MLRAVLTKKLVPVIMMASLCFGAAQPPSFAAKALTVKRVIEADVLELSNGKKVRLIGVKTPDINDPQANRRLAKKQKIDPGILQVYAFAARKFVQNVIERQFIYLTYDDAYQDDNHIDSTGMTLAYAWFPIYYRDSRDRKADQKTVLGITSEDRLLNAEIIRLGYGFADRGGVYAKKRDFVSFEDHAKKKGKGFWGSEEQGYDAKLERAQAAHIAATSDFVAPSVRQIGYNFAVKALEELIRTNPNDYRAYYERSWLGAHEFYDKLSAKNIKDINKALALAPNEPLLHAQKHYLLRLTHDHSKAAVAYDRAVALTMKLAAEPLISSGVRRGLNREALLMELDKSPDTAGLLEDAYRAGLNEDHFLFFMARFKQLQTTKHAAAARNVFDGMLKQTLFRKFYEEHRAMIDQSSPRKIIYQTNYGKTARQDAEAALEAMNQKVVPQS